MSDNASAPFNFGDLTKPATKMIESLSNCAYIMYEPTMIRKIAQARADAALIEAESKAAVSKTETRMKAEAAKELAAAQAEINLVMEKCEIQRFQLSERALAKLSKQELRRQQNIEAIAAKAFLSLPEQVSEVKPDEDWIHQFFSECQDIGDDQMQVIWGKLLAGEVAEPGTYSLLTLSVLKCMRKSVADLFTQFCIYVWFDHETPVTIIDYPCGTRYGESPLMPIPFRGIAQLSAHGLIELSQNYGHAFQMVADEPPKLRYFDKQFAVLSTSDDKPVIGIPTRQAFLSFVGRELVHLCGATPDYHYMNLVIEDLERNTIELREIS